MFQAEIHCYGNWPVGLCGFVPRDLRCSLVSLIGTSWLVYTRRFLIPLMFRFTSGSKNPRAENIGLLRVSWRYSGCVRLNLVGAITSPFYWCLKWLGIGNKVLGISVVGLKRGV